MSAYSGSFSGSFTGSYDGNGSQLTNIDYFTLQNLPQTITNFEENSIRANSALRGAFPANVKVRLDAESVISSSAQMSASMVLEGFGRADDAQPLLWSRIINLPNDIVSSSAQTMANVVENTHTDGNDNVSIGTDTLLNSLTGSDNVAIGVDALKSTISGSFNTAIGSNAGLNFLGSGSIFLGYKAGGSETISNKLNIHNGDVVNPLIGGSFDTRTVVVNGLLSQESLGNSTYFGQWAGEDDDLVDRQNVGIGQSALLSNNTGEMNVAVGLGALLSNESGTSHTAVGHGALSSMAIGTRSTSVGGNSFSNLTSGTDSVAIGNSAAAIDSVGTPVTAATYSVFIGGNSKPNATNETNQIVIGATAVGNGSNTATIGDANVVELHLMKPGASIAMRSPNGTVFKLTISDTGVLSIS